VTHASRTQSRRLVPDATFIRHQIPIIEVLDGLGISGDGRYFDCWRPHPNGTRQRTVGVHFKSNTIRCFRCDTRNLSVIDLVCAVRQVDAGDAIRWFASQWPSIPRRRMKLETNKWGRTKHAYRNYGSSTWPVPTCDEFVRSPSWARLRHPTKALAAAIIARVPQNRKLQPVVVSSYSEMQRWTGIGDRNTIAQAVRQLRHIGLIVTALASTGRRTPDGYAARQTLVRLTWFSSQFQTWLGASDRHTLPAHRGSNRASTTATGYAVGKPILSTKRLEDWEPEKGECVQ
jgi:hypothetical protein